MAIDQLGLSEIQKMNKFNEDLEKMNNMREIEQNIVSESKIKDGYQCGWCRRILQQPAGLLRHRSYCSWNPALRPANDDKRKLPQIFYPEPNFTPFFKEFLQNCMTC